MDNTTSIADKIIVLDEPGFSSRVSHENAALLGRLYVGLVVTPNAISHRDKGELGSVKEVSVFGGKVQELVGQAIDWQGPRAGRSSDCCTASVVLYS